MDGESRVLRSAGEGKEHVPMKAIGHEGAEEWSRQGGLCQELTIQPGLCWRPRGRTRRRVAGHLDRAGGRAALTLQELKEGVAELMSWVGCGWEREAIS